MASSRKLPSARSLLAAVPGERIAVALSGGMDSVVLLHLLKDAGVRAVHVHHGLSPNADAWAAFCRKLCRRWGVPLTVRKVKVRRAGMGLEAAAREARYAVFAALDADCIALAHHLDDQAETVLMNLLRGAGPRGAGGMRAMARFAGKRLARPLLEVPRERIADYARRHRLEWIEDESNADETLTRNFVRRRLAPLIEQRFPQWKRSLARGARHFARKDTRARDLLRAYLASKKLKAPSEAKLVEMLKQLTSEGSRTRLDHDGVTLRVYRGRLRLEEARAPARGFAPRPWRGELRLPLPELGGELRFRHARGAGLDPALVRDGIVRLRKGGERLQPDARRPRRTLKNLFQEAGVPPHERARLPLLCCGEDVVWAPRLGVDARYRAAAKARGLVPEWRPASASA
jgi:tRNA(Ile)-lysidine synthase